MWGLQVTYGCFSSPENKLIVFQINHSNIWFLHNKRTEKSTHLLFPQRSEGFFNIVFYMIDQKMLKFDMNLEAGAK